MIVALVVLILVTWWVNGMWGFTFWWRGDFPERPFPWRKCLEVGIMGPFTWWAGYEIHGKKDA